MAIGLESSEQHGNALQGRSVEMILLRIMLVSTLIGGLGTWTLLSAGSALGTGKPFAQCFVSHRMDCE